MSLSQLEFIKHIRDECEVLMQVSKYPPEKIWNDQLASRGIIRSLEIIGEATKHISEDFRAKYPQIDWKDMAGMRDKLIHHYFGVDHDTVWHTIINDIPELYHEIKRIIDIEGR